MQPAGKISNWFVEIEWTYIVRKRLTENDATAISLRISSCEFPVVLHCTRRLGECVLSHPFRSALVESRRSRGGFLKNVWLQLLLNGRSTILFHFNRKRLGSGEKSLFKSLPHYFHPASADNLFYPRELSFSRYSVKLLHSPQTPYLKTPRIDMSHRSRQLNLRICL